MNAPPQIPPRSLKLFSTIVKWSLWVLLAAWLVMALAWGTLHGWIVPRIAEFRPALEAEASRVLGVPVRIGHITALTEGLVPSFELQDVVLLDPRGREALKLPLVVAAISPRSAWKLGFEQLYVHRPELDIRRAADGRIFIAGLEFSRRAGSDDDAAADWLFDQPEFILQGGTVRWTDELRGAPTLALEQVDLVMRNKGRRHAVRLDATPPPAWGARFTLAGVFRQPLLTRNPGRWQEWAGQLYAEFGQVELPQLRQHVPMEATRIARGAGALRAWVDVDRGQVVGATADVALTAVDATLGRRLAPLALKSVSGRLGGRRLPGGFEFETQGLQFETADGERWPGGNVFLAWTGAEGGRAERGEFRADRLDLAALAQIATRLPLGDETHAALQAYGPRGRVDTIEARWQGPLAAPVSYEARGRAAAVEVAAVAGAGGAAGTPGVRGASLDFDLTQAGGKARVAIERGMLQFPGVFEEPDVPVDSLTGELQWQRSGGQLSVSLRQLRFSNADAQGEAAVSWRTAGGAEAGDARYPGILDLQGSLSRADGTRVWRYLPLGVPKDARDYVRESVQAGVATAARFRVRGDLRHFPFEDGRQGEFRVTANVRDVTYAYVPRSLNEGPLAWPALTKLAGELVFQGNGMQVKGASGSFAGLPRLQVRADARIPDFDRTVVAVDGQVKGPLADSLAYVNGSPVSPMIQQALARATATGNADLALRLSLPVDEMARSRVQGSVVLAGNDLQITPDSPLLARARGAVHFSETGFQLAGTQARALGGDVRLEGGSRTGPPPAAGAPEPPSVLLRAQGVATAEGLRQARELGFVARLAQDMSGSAAYALNLAFRRGHPEIQVTSNLQGLAFDWPAPLAKSADSALPLRYETVLAPESLQPGATVLREQLSVDLGRIAALAYVRDVSGETPQVLRGGIRVGLAPGESVAVPEEGVMANVNLAHFDVDAWEDALARAAPTGETYALRSGESSPAMGYLPTTMAIRARQVSVEGRTLHNVVLGGSRDGRFWRANVEADELNGYVEYRQPAGAGAGRVYARLARLNIAAAAASEVETLLEQQPGSIPALDVVVDDFELKGRKLGRLEIDAVNRGAGTVSREGGIREWRLNRLSLSTPEAVFSASGNWAEVGAQPAAPGGPRPPAAGGERRRTAMTFRLDIQDAGQLLARFGMVDVVRRGSGLMEGTMSWVGSPLALNHPTMSGHFNVNIESGQFLKADPGLAKLLGVLSLQSLPRRLALDFRDVFSQGFAFDFVRGDIAVEQGIASTNNLQMKGVNAAVLMEGRADIARETQHLKVVVIPEINAGTASLVATVINPAIGLGSFLAQMFLREPLARAATQEFQIDGTWADPRVTRVGRGTAPSEPAEGAKR